MYNPSAGFKSTVDNPGRVTRLQLTYDDLIVISSDDIVTSFSYEDSMLSDSNSSYIGSFVAKKIKFSYYTKYPGLNPVSINKHVQVEEGLYVTSAYEYIPLGTYIINAENTDVKRDITEVEGIDYSYLFDKTYVSTYTTGMTAYDWALSICEVVGVELGSTSWFNSTQVLANEPVIEGTYRDAVKHIAQAGLCFAKIGRDNKLYFKDFVVDTLQINNVFEYTFDFEYGPVNKLVFGKGSTNDNVSDLDQVSIDANGLTEILIDNNEIINYLDRESIISTYFAELSGLMYDIINVNYPGNPCIDVGDVIQFLDDNDVYQTIYVMNHSFEHNGSWYGIIKSEGMSKTDTNSNYKGSYDKRISTTEINVDKANQEIQLIAQRTTDTETNVSQILIDIDSIESRVSSNESDISGLQTTVTQTAEDLTIEIERVDELNRYYQYSIDGLTIGADDSPAQIFIGFEDIGGIDTPYMLLTDGANNTAKIQSNVMTIEKIVVDGDAQLGYHKISKYTLGADTVTVFQKI